MDDSSEKLSTLAMADEQVGTGPLSPNVQDIEEAIRRAEELMSKDLELLQFNSEDVRPFPSSSSLPSSSSSSASLASAQSDTEQPLETHRRSSRVRQSNKYKTPQAREDLIQKLLRDREQALESQRETDRLAEELEMRQIERHRREELARVDTSVERDLPLEEKALDDLHTAFQQAKTHSTTHRPRSASVSNQPNRASRNSFRSVPGNSRVNPRIPQKQDSQQKAFYRKSLDQIKLQLEQEHAKNCTFRPKINPYHKKPERREARLERLAMPRVEYWHKLELQKRQMEEEELSKSCTFRPDLPAAKSVLEASGDDSSRTAWQQRVREAYRNNVPVESRLFQDASQRWEARERAKRELEEAELQAQTFRPKVNPVSEEIARQIDYEPIVVRAARVQREKQERLAKKKLEYEMTNEDLTFKPRISESSLRLAEEVALKRGQPIRQDVVNRLLSNSNNLEEKKKRRQKALAEQEGQEYKFKPKVSENSKKLLSTHPAYKENIDFVKRQEILEEERKLKEQRFRAEYHDMGGVATFRPDVRRISNPDRVLMQSKPERLVENEDQRFNRLYKADQMRREKLQAAIREHYYAQYNFKPQINPVSAEIVRETHKTGPELYEDLYRNERGKLYKKVAKTQLEEENLKDCTFKPRTLRRPNTQASEIIRASRAESSEAIHVMEKQRRLKEQRLLQQKREYEYEELQECTFTPKVNDVATSVKAKGPVVVRGLGRYLELQELAKRQEQEKREREAKIFLQDTASIRPEPYTVPQPFNLSQPVKSKYPKYKGELPSDCTFKPRTTKSAQQKQIRKILAASNS